jgi:DNA-binding IclR family transcriptional regulator
LKSKIDELLEYLALDDDAHSIEEISEVLGIPHDVCERIADFLSKYNFIQFNNSEAKIEPRMRDFVITSSQEKPILRILPSVTTIPSQ